MKNLNQVILDKIVEQSVSNKNIHGAVFHVESVDKTLSLISASGNITPDNQYYIASINKLLISFIIHRLCQERKLNLADKISQYLPMDLIKGLLIYKGTDYANEISIYHLISQTSGLPCYLIDKLPDGKKNMDLILNGNDQAWPINEVVEQIKTMKVKYKPGSKGKANYSETNFRLLGKLLEVKTGKTISELLTSTFEELEMSQTFILPSELTNNFVSPYFKQNPINLEKYWKSTSHDIASTAKDQMKFIRAFFDGDFIPKKHISDLKKWNNIFFPFKYGIGIQKFYIPRLLSPFQAVPEIIGHCGSVGSIAFYVPEKQIYVTGTVNQSSNPNIAFQTIIKILNRL